jgi:phosphoketolase
MVLCDLAMSMKPCHQLMAMVSLILMTHEQFTILLLSIRHTLAPLYPLVIIRTATTATTTVVVEEAFVTGTLEVAEVTMEMTSHVTRNRETTTLLITNPKPQLWERRRSARPTRSVLPLVWIRSLKMTKVRRRF